jgi:hypothetical protein
MYSILFRVSGMDSNPATPMGFDMAHHGTHHDTHQTTTTATRMPSADVASSAMQFGQDDPDLHAFSSAISQSIDMH